MGGESGPIGCAILFVKTKNLEDKRIKKNLHTYVTRNHVDLHNA
jgi:hypothetical protein